MVVLTLTDEETEAQSFHSTHVQKTSQTQTRLSPKDVTHPPLAPSRVGSACGSEPTSIPL